jgi:NifU-like protein involved in Fe-S cluster formation
MNASTTYNEAVRGYFANPAHAGDLQGSFDLTIVADESESEGGAQVILAAGIQAGSIAEMAYRAWGCPHLIAALELVCETLVNQPVESLEIFDSADITQNLAVPTEKSGRILLVEDALAALWAQVAGADT